MFPEDIIRHRDTEIQNADLNQYQLLSRINYQANRLAGNFR